MYKYFIDCELIEESFDELLKTFKDGEIMGKVKFEFHNDSSFRIYIENDRNENVMLSVYRVEK